MAKKESFNSDKVNLEMFNCSNIDEYIDIPENEQEVNERCVEYLNIDYPITLHKVVDDNSDYWVAEHPDLPGCKTHGETKEQAITNLEDAKKGWIYAKICDDEDVPIPGDSFAYAKCSGRILLRLPKDLHYKLVNKSKKDQVSINQEIIYLLTYALGQTDLNNKIMDSLMEITAIINKQTTQNAPLNVVTANSKHIPEIMLKE
ncbi:hypothetical protein DCCM_1061 [Desulfocucumis palustris]|uniref:HicB-like antitoxin of toxin-antitoxin system domain-containing protein n=1 Tax=Desulfocucumis palustris TaxID=1898651 RepID=A0A2L2X9J1_9FIRM|nr:type II toxin-antitoxin system HicB family antitoxin [Desulfocucumis palustris]GBF32865.1 hypothetical protein DCCM_1061 [Desulfocucumis palustris]